MLTGETSLARNSPVPLPDARLESPCQSPDLSPVRRSKPALCLEGRLASHPGRHHGLAVDAVHHAVRDKDPDSSCASTDATTDVACGAPP